MQCSSYSPDFYSSRDLNGVPNNGHWPVYTNDIVPNMSAQSCNLYPSPNANQIKVVYHNDVLKQTMLRHDNIFREQVQELHRLHSRQRELMGEYKRRGLKNPNIVPTSHYSFIVSKVSSYCASTTWQTPKSPVPTFNFLDTLSGKKNGFENNEVLPPAGKKAKLKMLDLELPANECVDCEEDKVYEIHMNSYCSSDRNGNTMAFDLNMPPNPLESEIFQTSMEIKVKEKPQYNNNHPEGVIEIKSKMNQFDLNTCVDEDELLSTMPISKTVELVPDIDLEAPLSPENKENSPPRGDSEDYLDPNNDLVSTAATTIFLISTTSFKEKRKASLVESLDWFAGIVVSSMENDGSGKEESNCVVALPSQHGKRHRKRRMNRKVLENEAFRAVSSLMSHDMGFGQIGTNSWGKGNKRRRGSRVPASKIRLLWS